MTFQYWYMFPTALLVATIAMASGVGGATFLTPIFILGLRLPPEVAIGTGLLTEVFGFASGLIAYARKRLIDYRLGASLLVVTIPVALLGTWVAGGIEPDILKVILGVGLFAVALSFLRAPEHKDVVRMDAAIQKEYGGAQSETCLVTAEGEQVCYTVCNRNEGRLIVGVGGLFVGLISTGLGELNGYFLLQRCRVPSKVAVATSVFIVAVTALAGATGHMVQFVQSGRDVLNTALSIAVFTIPGVILGGQLGSIVASRISQHTLERGLGILYSGSHTYVGGGASMIETMIFDLDGTLVQTEKLKALSYAKAAVQLCPNHLEESEVIDAFKKVVGLSRHEVAMALVERFDLEEKARSKMGEFAVDTPWQAYVQVRLRIYEEMLADPDVIRHNQWPHNMDLLQAARRVCRYVGLATMSYCSQVKRILQILELTAAFDFVASRDDVEHGKPDPEIYCLVAHEFGVAPAECLVVEDSPTGVQAASAAGMAVMAVSTPFTLERLHTSGLLPEARIVDEPGRVAAVAADIVRQSQAHF